MDVLSNSIIVARCFNVGVTVRELNDSCQSLGKVEAHKHTHTHVCVEKVKLIHFCESVRKFVDVSETEIDNETFCVRKYEL